MGLHHHRCAAMDGGERRGRHVQGWTFDPQLRQHKKRAGVVGGVHNRTPPAAQAKKQAHALQSANIDMLLSV